MADPVGNPNYSGVRGPQPGKTRVSAMAASMAACAAGKPMVPSETMPKETDAQKVKRYGTALDQILARPSYPVALKIAQEARHPNPKEQK